MIFRAADAGVGGCYFWANSLCWLGLFSCVLLVFEKGLAAMDSRTLVYEALAHRPVPRVPCSIAFTTQARDIFLADAEGKQLYHELDNDISASPVTRIEFGMRDERGWYTDEFSVAWDRHIDADIGTPHANMQPGGIESWPWPDPAEPERFLPLEQNLRDHPDKFQVIGFNFALYERAWSLRGLANFLADMVENKPFVRALLERICEFNLTVMEIALSEYPEIDGVYFGDDFGTQVGLMMGPGLWRELIRPVVARQYAFAKDAGKKVFIHSCGRVQELFDDFIELGVDCFNPFQPEVMDVHQLLDEYHGRLCFHGGISTQRLLPFGTCEQVEAEVAKLLEKGRRGGYIISPAHDIPRDAKVENVAAMLAKIINQPV